MNIESQSASALAFISKAISAYTCVVSRDTCPNPSTQQMNRRGVAQSMGADAFGSKRRDVVVGKRHITLDQRLDADPGEGFLATIQEH